MEILVLKPLVVGKLSVFSGMYNDALMHREDLKAMTYVCITNGEQRVSFHFEIIINVSVSSFCFT